MSMRKFSFILAALSFPLCMIGQGILDSAKQTFKQHFEMLLKSEGKWRALNPGFNESDSTAASYTGYFFTKGINEWTFNLDIQSYVPGNSGWKAQWNGYFTWDAISGKVVCHGVDANGEVSTGVIDSLSNNRLVMILNPGKSTSAKTRKMKWTFRDSGFEVEDFTVPGRKSKAHATLFFTELEKPSGRISFMSTRDGNFEVYAMDIDGANLRNLSCNKATDYAFSYFPDGRLCFYTNRDGNDEIYLMSVDGRRQTNITNNKASDRIPCVSPDGTMIAFLSNRDDSNGEIYLVDTTGAGLRRLTENENFEDGPTWSPDGSRIIFTRELKEDTSAKAPGNGEIFVIDVDGKNERRLTNRPGYDGGPQFSPDGKRIAFYGKTATGKYDIFLMDADGGNVANLTNDAMENYSPSWSKDGKWVAYTGGDSRNYDIWVIHLATGIKRRLTTQLRRDESPFW